MTGATARRLTAGIVAGGVLLAGCGAAPDDRPTPEPLAADPTLHALREAGGIADCPATPLEADPIAGGLPDLVLGCLGSGRQTNLAALRGTPTVVNVWAQWCGPCRQEAPHLAEYAARVGGRVRVLGLDYDDPDPAAALEYAGQAGWTYPHLADPLRRTRDPLRITGIPTTLFISADGVIQHRVVGPVASADQLADLTATHLGVRP